MFSGIGVAVLVLILLFLYLTQQTEQIKTILLVLLVIVGLLGTFLILWEAFRGAHAMRTMLQSVDLTQQPPEIVRQKYLKIYTLYMKLPEGEKRNFYARVLKLREQLEEQLQAQKAVQGLLEKVTRGTITERKKTYDQLHAQFQKLSPLIQKHYYPELVQVKAELEPGK